MSLEASNSTGLGVAEVLFQVTVSSPKLGLRIIVNPLHACRARVTVAILCVCVCVSVFSILLSHTFWHLMKGISNYSTGNAVN